MKQLFNKKGDIPSLFYAVIVIFAIAIVLLFFNKFFNEFYDATNTAYLSSGIDFQNSTAQDTLKTIQASDNSTYDYITLWIVVGMVLSMSILSYSTRVSNVFFWIYALMSFFVIMVATIASNVWQSMADNAQFADTITRFPITNLILGTYYPLFALILVLLTMLFLFGKIGRSR